jgi:hypothetical protein
MAHSSNIGYFTLSSCSRGIHHSKLSLPSSLTLSMNISEDTHKSAAGGPVKLDRIRYATATSSADQCARSKSVIQGVLVGHPRSRCSSGSDHAECTVRRRACASSIMTSCLLGIFGRATGARSGHSGPGRTQPPSAEPGPRRCADVRLGSRQAARGVAPYVVRAG